MKNLQIIIFSFLLVLISQKSFSQYSLEWIARYNNDTLGFSHDIVHNMVIDNEGNTIVTGQSYYLITTVKYNPFGNQIWVRHYQNSYPLAWDIPRAIKTDDSGNVYIIGDLKTSSAFDYVTLKYDKDGNLKWVRTFSNPYHVNDIPTAVAIYNDKYIYVTGFNAYGETDSTNFKWTTIKYDLDGNQKWLRQFFGYHDYPLGGYAPPPSLAIDSSGNVIINGVSKIYQAMDYEMITIKYDSSGNQLWLKRNLNIFQSGSIAVDGASNIYVGIYNGFMKFNSEGDSIIAQTSHRVSYLNLDTNGNVIITGDSISNNINKIQTSKFDSSGNLIWSAQTSGGYHLTSTSVNKNGKIFIAARGQGNNNYKYNMFVYSNSGSLIWSSFYEDTLDTACIPVKILSDDFDNIYITGNSFGIGTRSNFLTLKYSFLTKNNFTSTNIPKNYSLHQNYPNPFNPVTNIKFSLPSAKYTILKIFDIAGREVATLVNEVLQAGSYEFTFDAGRISSGVYFYQLSAGDFVRTRKMVLLR